MTSVALENARHEWEEASRQLEAERSDRARYERLLQQVEVVTAELRRRVGQSFTLADLVAAYADAERWVRDALDEADPPAGWPRTMTVVQGAAFHGSARGAVDYEP